MAAADVSDPTGRQSHCLMVLASRPGFVLTLLRVSIPAAPLLREHGRGRPRAQLAACGPNAVKGAPNGRCASAVAAEAATL